MIWIYAVIVILFIGASARWNWWRFKNRGVPILMYHKIGDPPVNSKLKKLWVSKEKFSRQLMYLKKNNYKTMTFTEIAGGKKPDSSTVIITFDDGYQNNYEHAVPLLRKHGFKAVFFVAVDAVGKDNFWHNPVSEERIPLMSKDVLEKIVTQGHEVGSHSLTHPNLERINTKEARDEIIHSHNKLKNIIGKEIVSFAYPYGAGAYNEAIQTVMKNSGYSFACSIRQGKADFEGNPYLLKRLLIRGDDTIFDFHLNMTRGKSRF